MKFAENVRGVQFAGNVSGVKFAGSATGMRSLGRVAGVTGTDAARAAVDPLRRILMGSKVKQFPM